MMEYSPEAILTVWGVSLGLAVIVVVVVAVLLHQIKNTATAIDEVASDIWTQGKLVANNTIHIPTMLGTTNRVARQILSAAGRVLNGVKAVEQHIDGCPGCPDCVLDHNTVQSTNPVP